MKALISYALLHNRTILSLLLLILIAGSASYIAIPKESDPDINIPIIYVSITLEGIAPEDSERLLLQPMEEELRAIASIEEMRSTAYEGGANITLKFNAGFDPVQAINDVREKVDIAKLDLPKNADEPRVHEVNFSLFPVLIVTLSGNVDEHILLQTSRKLQKLVEEIPSVLAVHLVGYREEAIEVLINPLELESYNLQANDLLEIFQRSNNLITSAALDNGTGRFPIKMPGLYQNITDILNQPIKANGDAIVRIRDIGTVHRSFRDRQTYARFNGQPTIALEISKRSGQNIIDATENIRAVVNNAEKDFPAGIRLNFSQDKSNNIQNMLNDLQNNVITATLLVITVIIGALGIRSAWLIGMAIPGSLLLSILVLSSLGITINIVVLFSLILAVGMMVDGAIVVTEFAERKIISGVSRPKAYLLASQRMAWPIITSTATTIAAFFPLLFWPGLVGEFMKFLPITLLTTLLASLLMALIFIPALGAQIGGTITLNSSYSLQIAASETGDLNNIKGLTACYLKLLKTALRIPKIVLLISIATLIAIQYYYISYGKGIEFFPNVEPDNAQIYVHARGNLSIEEKLSLVLPVEQIIMKLGGLKSIYTCIGATKQSEEGELSNDIIGSIQVEFIDWQQRLPAKQILAKIARQTSSLPGIVVETRTEGNVLTTGSPVQIQLYSRNREALEEAANDMLAKLHTIPGLLALEDTRDFPGIEWEISINREKAAIYAADMMLTGQYVQLITKGLKISDYRPKDSDKEIDVILRYPDYYRTFEQLDQTRMKTLNGLVPISNFVERRAKAKIGKVRRIDTYRAITIKADVLDGVLPNDKVMEIRDWLVSKPLPQSVKVVFKGEEKKQKEAHNFLIKSFGISIFVMAIILVTQFNSFYSVLVTLSAVVMSTIGVMFGLIITKSPFSIVMNGIGIIALSGIVVNNNIVLIDTFDKIKSNCSDTREAILRTGAQRLRPVLLTTLTTILGLLPMVMRTNIDFMSRHINIGAPSTQIWVSLANAIVYGLAFSTVLTLLVTPCALIFKTSIDKNMP
ncbi:multidrug efflux transporter VexF [Candidatus Endolissoclinum faulkneri L5]|uniref:Multidrug efflux transporter VexF n=1 Tax=Candidatus Endolissoclinum faulkneri L5 TaxID=1401328 RepID=V9TTA2_9PROT|nr:efflux RND transporter permease subunit [Candidatus Endolissoclinum faulkneri]AHC73811.1 multidrug efflux transporter VexF [Candidatus Endolissoclinum faulkneri L5]